MTVDSLGSAASLETVFAPVRSQTAFEETVERLATAIKLGLLPPGARLPAERELCSRLGIARSTLRQALTALGQSGHVHATRGRGGRTLVAHPLAPARPPGPGRHPSSCSRAGARLATSAWRSSSASPCSPPNAPTRRPSRASTSSS